MADISRETRRADLQRELRNAKARLARAERVIGNIKDELASMDGEDALDLIRSWRGVPDWSALLEAERGMHRYMLANFLLQRMGLSNSGIWSDTKQIAVSVGVPTSADPVLANAAVARRRAALETVVPFILPTHNTSACRFHVLGRGIEDFALILRLSPDLASVSLARLVFRSVEEEIQFATLGEALIHIQAEYPCYDVADEWRPNPDHAPGETGEALRRALTAFIEGCRSAGMPIEAAEVGSFPVVGAT
jgi:hypothetical protein